MRCFTTEWPYIGRIITGLSEGASKIIYPSRQSLHPRRLFYGCKHGFPHQVKNGTVPVSREMNAGDARFSFGGIGTFYHQAGGKSG